MSHRGDLAVKIDEGGSPAASAAKSDDKLKPPRLAASGPSPREEGRVSPRKTNSLTPRKHGPDEARAEKSTTPRKEGSQLQRKEVGSKPKGGFLASFFGDAQPSTSPVPERAESSPSAKGSKRRAGSTSMTNEQLVYIRESALAADNSVGRNSSSGIASPDVAKDSPRGKSINFMSSPAPTGGSSIMKDPWKAKQVKSANAALSAELQLLQQYKLREKQYAKQTNAATPFKYLELNPEDVEILLKTPRSASSASSGSSGGTEPAAELLKLDPTSWAKWHIEMSEKLKQRKAEAAASLVKSQRVRMYNLDSKKPGTIPKKLPSGSPTPTLIPSSASGTMHKEKEKRRESESEPSPSASTDAVAPSPRVSGVGESDVARRSGRGLALKT